MGSFRHRPTPLGTREGLGMGDRERSDGSRAIYFGPREPDESLLEIAITIKEEIVVGITVSDQE